MYLLAPPRPHEGVSAQASFSFENFQRDLLQTFYQGLVWHSGLAISNQRWHERTDVFTLLPASLSLLANQVKSGRRHGVSLQQTLAIRIGKTPIRRQALLFWMAVVLRKDHFECLWHDEQVWRAQSFESVYGAPEKLIGIAAHPVIATAPVAGLMAIPLAPCKVQPFWQSPLAATGDWNRHRRARRTCYLLATLPIGCGSFSIDQDELY